MSEKEQVKEETALEEGFVGVRLSDDAILVIREVLQFCLLTGRNFVDMSRGMVFNVEGDVLYPSPKYVAAYNELVERLNAEALEKAKEREALALIEKAALEAEARGGVGEA